MGYVGRSEVLTFRLSAEEKAIFYELARQDRRPMSEAMRELVRAEAARRGLWPPKDVQPAAAGSMMIEAR